MSEFNLSNAVEEEECELAPEGSLERAIQMGKLMSAADEKVTRLTEELKAAKARFNGIAMDTLPTLLKELGLESIKLETGETIEVKGDLSASITAANNFAAMKWLVDNSYGGIIKTLVTTTFAANEHDLAVEFAAMVGEDHEGVVFKETVHPMTLKSFIKEQLASGGAIPLELFSVHEYSVAKLTQPKG